MGNKASSRSRVENETVVLNQTDIDICNQNINSIVTNSIVNAASSCSASINQLQKIVIKDIKSKSDVSITTGQKQTAALTFDCINSSQIRNDIAQNIITKLMNDLTENNKTDILDKLNAISQAKQENKGLPTSLASSSSSDQEVVNKTRIENISRTHLNEVIQNSVVNNFTTNDVSSAIATVVNSQEANIQKVDVEGKVLIALTQEQGAELMLKVINKKDIGNKITNSLTTGLGVKIEKDTTSDIKKDTSAQSSATTYSADPLSSAVSDITGFLGGLFGGNSSIWTYIIIILVILCIVGALYLYFKNKKK